MTLHIPQRAAGIGNTEMQMSQSGMTASRDATSNALDANLGTYDYVNFSQDEHEYTFNAGTKKLRRAEITITINQGAGWASDSNLDWYYIPSGETDPANYVYFANYNYPGMIDYTNYVISREITSNTGWVWADGVYIVFTGANIEGGWAYIQEFRAYVCMG